MKLDDWREEIDSIDGKIVRLIGQRAKLVRKIGELKVKNGISIIDSKREEEVLRKACRSIGDVHESSVRNIFGQIFRESRQIQIDVCKSFRREDAGLY